MQTKTHTIHGLSLVSTIIQAGLLVGILILIPLIYTEALPKGMLATLHCPTATATTASSASHGCAYRVHREACKFI